MAGVTRATAVALAAVILLVATMWGIGEVTGLNGRCVRDPTATLCGCP